MKVEASLAASSPVPCRIGCGACCVVISTSSAIPGMPHGKPAGVRCVQLTEDNRCRLFGQPERPAICVSFRASREQCGDRDETAYRNLAWLESATA
jgi:Fe-S-cluster containining protein